MRSRSDNDVLAMMRWLMFIVALAACASWASQARADGRFCITASTLTFGNQPVGTSASQGVQVSNCGDAPWMFTDVSVHPETGAAFSVATTCATGMSLAPGASCGATITFAPGTPGQTSGGLWLRNTTADANRLLTFYGRGVDAQSGTATLNFVPTSANFGVQRIATESPPLVVELHNQGPAAMTLTAIVVNGPQVDDFDGLEDTCQVGTTIAAGDSCELSLFFLPTATGLRVANLVIDSPQLASLAILQVSGVGSNGAPPTLTVVEYYHAAFDHYFITPLAGEIALCDAGTTPCEGWLRTGHSFNGFASDSAPPASASVCRFFNNSFAPRSSHFYALHGFGCEQTIAQFPDWQLESSALFAMMVPDSAGRCPANTLPVYRLYNNGMGGAPNHRFTIDTSVRTQMIAAGWVPEGFGIGVTFCSPK